MARIIGGIAASHTPTIGFAYDRNKRDESLEAFQLTRNAPGALYSVAGKGRKPRLGPVAGHGSTALNHDRSARHRIVKRGV